MFRLRRSLIDILELETVPQDVATAPPPERLGFPTSLFFCFIEAEAEVEAESSRPRRGRLNLRQGRGEATRRKTLLPLDV